MMRLVIDTVGMGPGDAFVYCAPNSDVRDPRIDGRFGGTSPCYLMTYSSAELGHSTGDAFGGVFVEASSRRAAIVKMLRALGYPRGTKFEITFERD